MPVRVRRLRSSKGDTGEEMELSEDIEGSKYRLNPLGIILL
jgi:hypothetical protein